MSERAYSINNPDGIYFVTPALARLSKNCCRLALPSDLYVFGILPWFLYLILKRYRFIHTFMFFTTFCF
ncbi:hypothetical protein Fleli_0398 [Bernardetia litoralis DSM 6794]|uniref:Uncharacterized protein n=1 Tax=Bernardetia litoralis (strain ATCC 23117 / DSM 6794 / NBRC 15988 / NCIMB 1366 / Fx l1 / Sio-4) TaxID=880071 RepID=I4AFS9_BERLS|nr:hypothetical protein Fleli_0329 [Bernardetia litoralis DSM 6794]AFM02872.1 hypothetical protein Fleli_0395 [Bernardetia litoralis DSM 6794]AFM02875.1 hypothetical protein Fleli_0398 [Bernardetia litoralis DSM 6794]